MGFAGVLCAAGVLLQVTWSGYAACTDGAGGYGSSKCPRRSDVCFTSREYHAIHPLGTNLTTWQAAAAYNATRLDWIYTSNATVIADAHKRGIFSDSLHHEWIFFNVCYFYHRIFFEPRVVWGVYHNIAPNELGLGVVTPAINANMADANGSRVLGRIRNVVGDMLSAPWMRAWPGGGSAYGCVNTDAYVTVTPYS